MENFQTDLQYLQTGVAALKDYLLSDELFWAIKVPGQAGRSGYPKLTVGNLLFYLKRAEGLAGSASRETEVVRIKNEIYALSSRWRTAWEGKAKREFESRLRQWAAYLNELHKDQDKNAVFYSNEVRLRVLLQILGGELGEFEKELAGIDQLLKSVFIEGEFIWEGALQSVFPEEDYWFLYGGIRQN